MAALLSFEGNAARVFTHLGRNAHPAGGPQSAKRGYLGRSGLVFGVADQHDSKSRRGPPVRNRKHYDLATPLGLQPGIRWAKVPPARMVPEHPEN